MFNSISNIHDCDLQDGDHVIKVTQPLAACSSYPTRSFIFTPKAAFTECLIMSGNSPSAPVSGKPSTFGLLNNLSDLDFSLLYLITSSQNQERMDVVMLLPKMTSTGLQDTGNRQGLQRGGENAHRCGSRCPLTLYCLDMVSVVVCAAEDAREAHLLRIRRRRNSLLSRCRSRREEFQVTLNRPDLRNRLSPATIAITRHWEHFLLGRGPHDCHLR